jgi:branched-chain amino acid aminotransferase
MAYFNSETVLYFDGQFSKASETKIDLYSQSLHYGYAVIEGIRSYKTASGKTKILEAKAHYDRLKRSAEALNLPYTYETETLIRHTYDLLEKNNIQNAYIRPLVFAPDNMSFNANNVSHLVIQCWEQPKFLGEKLLRVGISSFQRPNPQAFKIYAKAAGHYVNSIMASQEVKSKGFDEALLLDQHGYVAEGPGANIFIEKDGKLFTPSLGYILPGITRQLVIELCEELEIPVFEKEINVSELKQADAAFYCGTAAEVVGFESIDEYKFPLKWSDSVSAKLQNAFNKLVIAD